MASQRTCCEDLFSDFTFWDIRAAAPPKTKGIYAVRVTRRGKPVADILQQVGEAIEHLDWPIVGKKMVSRVDRLVKIDACPVIYIGSAGTRPSSEYTLKGRYSDFAGRHTAMYPLWALLYFSWDLQYGWKEGENSASLEENLKRRYKERHSGKLPALMDK